jgi:hypothetical protein
MKNKQKGFIIPALLIIVIVACFIFIGSRLTADKTDSMATVSTQNNIFQMIGNFFRGGNGEPSKAPTPKPAVKTIPKPGADVYAQQGLECSDWKACNYNSKAKSRTLCTYSVYQICTTDKDCKDSDFQKSISPFPESGTVLGPTINKRATGQDPNRPTGTNTYNVKIHTWTVNSTEDEVSSSVTDLGGQNISDFDLKTLQTKTSACTAKKQVDEAAAASKAKPSVIKPGLSTQN